MVRAQSATFQATAVVQTALTAAGTRALSFGAAFPNTTRTIETSDATAGYFTLNGANGAEVSFTFPSLPTALANGVTSLPVSFTSAWATTLAGSQTAIGSMAGATLQRLDAADGTLFVFVGGSVLPTTQAAGTYTATVTLNAAYTGN
jgi:hypothetical protein